jgi:hypothetical protein
MKQINNISTLGFGAMRLPDNFAQSEELILHAIDSGVNYFDTAYIYPGKEALLGKILQKNNLREKVKLATKLPIFLSKSYSDFDKFFNKQLARLKTDYIDYYMLHMLSSPDELQGLIALGIEKWVEEKKSSGQIRHFGFSFHGKTDDFIKLIDFRKQNKQCLWEFTMIQYNFLDTHYQAGVQGLKYAHSKNIPVIIMEPLRGGLLGKHAELALKWLWNQNEVTCVLSGMKNMSDLTCNIMLANSSHPDCLTDNEQREIEKITADFKKSHAIPCTGCNYCMSLGGKAVCPVGVNIPGSFMAYNEKSLQMYVQSCGALRSKSGLASSCIGCGKCEPMCPQRIEIVKSLKKVSRKLEPWWVKVGLSVVRVFTGLKQPRSR